jgi:glycosyltransferase involved in cell wall biosynthesis
MATPEVSVVIPTRNRRMLLARGLGTVIGQRGVDLEVFVIDEGSSDGTAEFVGGLHDSRVTLIRHQTPKGVAEARNAGIARARAPWVAFLDDDDFWAPNKLALQLEAARSGAKWVCAGAVIVDVGLNILGAWQVPSEPDMALLLSYNCVPGGGSGPMVRTALAREVGGFDSRLSILADWDMWIRLLLQSMPASVNRPLVGYLRHSESMSHVDRGFRGELQWIVDKHEGARRSRGVWVHRDRWLKWAAAGKLRAGNRREALQIYAHLIYRYHDPKSIARAILAGLFPSLLVRCWNLNMRRRMPPVWRAHAENWLAPLKSKRCLPQTRLPWGREAIFASRP